MRAGIAAQVDHRWVKSSDYPKRQISQSEFNDTLGHGHEATATFTGLASQLDLTYTIRVYSDRPYGEIRVQVKNNSGRGVEVQSIRTVEALGNAILDLHSNASADRVLSDSFSDIIARDLTDRIKRTKKRFRDRVTASHRVEQSSRPKL